MAATQSLEARTVNACRDRGWKAENVTKRLYRPLDRKVKVDGRERQPFLPLHRSKDVFGFIDVMALDTSARRIVAIQATDNTHVAARLAKIAANDFSRSWLYCGGRIEIWAWSQPGGKGSRWHLRVRNIEKL